MNLIFPENHARSDAYENRVGVTAGQLQSPLNQSHESESSEGVPGHAVGLGAEPFVGVFGVTWANARRKAVVAAEVS